jgi:hypothetical protein
MRWTCVFVFLFAVAAQGEIVVGDEQLLHGPYNAAPRDQSFALAHGPEGMLLAWSEVDPETQLAVVRTMLLGRDGKPAGPIHTLPPSRENVHATSPDIAGDGSSFFIAWMHRDRYRLEPQNLGGILTDVRGAPAGNSFGLGPAVSGTPRVFFTGLEYRAFGAASYAIVDGAPKIIHHGSAPQRVPFANPDANGWVAWRTIVEICCGLSYWFTTYYHSLEWSILTDSGVRTGAVRRNGVITGSPAVSADGKDLLIVWGTRTAVSGLRVVNGKAGDVFARNADLDPGTSPSIAGNLVVFEQHGDLWGMLVDAGFNQPFLISGSGAREESPRLLQAGENRWFIAYTVDDGTNATLAGRFITIEE